MTVQADILKAIEGIEHGFQQAGQALSERIFHCRQVHGAEIVDARSLSESGRHAADGVFSEGPLAVAVVTADCLPILMSSRDGRVVAALHGGWQGLVAGIVGAAVARFNARGVASADIRVAIGPGIKACCYEVSAGFIEALQVGHGRLWEGAVPPWSQRRPLPERPPRFAPPEPRQAEQGA
ncbi:polyphenol oxidase family protein, partial [Pseudomonas aeruginosa]